jgi:hypothetical protein
MFLSSVYYPVWNLKDKETKVIWKFKVVKVYFSFRLELYFDSTPNPMDSEYPGFVGCDTT